MGSGAESGSGCAQQDEVQGIASLQQNAPRWPATDLAAEAMAAAAARGPSLPSVVSLAVPHIQQAYNWDCGLACALMVLHALGMQQLTLGSLLQLCPTRSIWTVDLAHLLAGCGARVQMLTVTLGANQAYTREQFYAETMQDDSRRVERLFQTAAAVGISVQQRSLALPHLRCVARSGGCLLVVLVDKATLASSALSTHSAGELGTTWSPGGQRRSGRLSLAAAQGADVGAGGGNGAAAAASFAAPAAGLAAAAGPAAGAVPAATAQRLQDAATPVAEASPAPGDSCITSAGGAGAAVLGVNGRSSGTPGGDGGFLGHYIVVCGYDLRSDEFELRDPASDRPRLWIPAAQLEAARKCFGTDEDLLVVAASGWAAEAAAVEAGFGAGQPAGQGVTWPRPAAAPQVGAAASGAEPAGAGAAGTAAACVAGMAGERWEEPATAGRGSLP